MLWLWIITPRHVKLLDAVLDTVIRSEQDLSASGSSYHDPRMVRYIPGMERVPRTYNVVRRKTSDARRHVLPLPASRMHHACESLANNKWKVD